MREYLHRRAIFRGHGEEFVVRQQGRITGSHVGKNNSTCFLTWIGEMTNFIPIRAAARLAGLFDNAAADIVEPTMIKTAQPAVFDAPVTQVGAAVRAVQPDQSGACLIVTKQEQILAENSNLHRRATWRQFFA